MKLQYRLEGLNCANCLSKIEDAVNKLDGVAKAEVNFLTTKMTLEIEESKRDRIAEQAIKIVNKYEPNVKVRRA